MADLNDQIDRIDHQHAKDEKPEDCMICRAETWIDDLKSRGMPLNEVRNMHLIASHTAMERETQRRKCEGYARIMMVLVSRLGGTADIMVEELDHQTGRLIQERIENGLRFLTTIPPAGKKIN